MVTATVSPIRSVEDIKNFVYRRLCLDHELLVDAFPTSETVLRKNSEDCGMMFCLHGPRAVKFSAIWEKEQNRILFYGPNGKRYTEVQLEDRE